MMPARRLLVISLLAALPTVSAAAGKYSWFSNEPTASVAQTRPAGVGVDVYRSVENPETDNGLSPEHKVSLYGDYSTRTTRLADDGDNTARKFSNFGVRWQHRVSTQDKLAVSTQQGESSTLRPATLSDPDALDKRTTVSWTRELSWAWKPSITGGVFLGDDGARDDMQGFVGRRYYGFAVGGELRLLEAHTPYVSFRMERSLYDMPVSTTDDGSIPGIVRTLEDSSRFAAGWRWQAARGLSFQAEASYGFNFNNSSEILPQDRERSRVFFGTRFDFK